MNYPIEFRSTTESAPGIETTWATHSGKFSSPVAIPPEFAGPGGGLSPEDLFNHALTNCFVATFKVYAQNSRLTFEGISAQSSLMVDLDEARKPVMKSIHVKVKITNPSDAKKALLLAEKAAKSGFILNSVKTQCHFDFEI